MNEKWRIERHDHSIPFGCWYWLLESAPGVGRLARAARWVKSHPSPGFLWVRRMRRSNAFVFSVDLGECECFERRMNTAFLFVFGAHYSFLFILIRLRRCRRMSIRMKWFWFPPHTHHRPNTVSHTHTRAQSLHFHLFWGIFCSVVAAAVAA